MSRWPSHDTERRVAAAQVVAHATEDMDVLDALERWHDQEGWT